MMKPEPSEVPRRFCSSPPRLSKNSLNSSSNGEPGGSCGMSRSLGPCCGTFWVVVMLTTVGINLSTMSAKLCGASRACADTTGDKARLTVASAAKPAALEYPMKSPRITSALQRRTGPEYRPNIEWGRRRAFESLSTWGPNVAQIKSLLYCRIFQRFDGVVTDPGDAVAGLPQPAFPG